jgi:hypothetical protein
MRSSIDAQRRATIARRASTMDECLFIDAGQRVTIAGRRSIVDERLVIVAQRVVILAERPATMDRCLASNDACSVAMDGRVSTIAQRVARSEFAGETPRTAPFGMGTSRLRPPRSPSNVTVSLLDKTRSPDCATIGGHGMPLVSHNG